MHADQLACTYTCVPVYICKANLDLSLVNATVTCGNRLRYLAVIMLSVHRMRTDWPVAYVGLSCCCTQRMPRMSELQTAQRALTRQPFVDINNALRDV